MLLHVDQEDTRDCHWYFSYHTTPKDYPLGMKMWIGFAGKEKARKDPMAISPIGGHLPDAPRSTISPSDRRGIDYRQNSNDNTDRQSSSGDTPFILSFPFFSFLLRHRSSRSTLPYPIPSQCSAVQCHPVQPELKAHLCILRHEKKANRRLISGQAEIARTRPI